MRDDTDRLIGGVRLKVAAAVANRKLKFQNDLRVARRRRIMRYFFFSFGAAGLGLILYLFYRSHWQPSSEMFFSVFGNLIAEAIIICIGFLIAKSLDDFPATASRISEDARGLLSAEVSKIVEDEFRSHEFLGLSESALSQMLMASYSRLLNADPDRWSETIMARADLLRKHEAEFHRIRSTFEDDLRLFVEKSASYFNDPQKNILALNKIAAKVKNKAIEPSFELLRSTKSSLEDVKNQIQAVNFN